MRELIYIFIGGGAGSVLRYGISSFTAKWFSVGVFPLGTFCVNLLGCFFMGLLSAFFLKSDTQLKFLLLTGFCGGFTTFSAFSAENFALWQNGQYTTLAVYVLLSVLLGLLALIAGFHAVRSDL